MGWIWTLLLNGVLGVGAYWSARFGLRQAAGWPRTLAAAVLAWSWLTIGMEWSGSVGWLARGPLLGWVGAGFLIGLGCKLWLRGPETAEIARPPARRWTWEEVVSLGLVVWAAVVRGKTPLFWPVKVVSDGPIYHLYFAVRWWKAGRLELIATPFGENAAPYFPAGGDLWFAWLVIGWGGDLLAKVGQAPFLALAGVATFALARRLGAGAPSASIATAWALTSFSLFAFSAEPNVDTIFVAGYLVSAYFFLRHAMGDDGPASLALGGLAAGCALGTKAPAFVFVSTLLALGVASAVRRGGRATGNLLGGLIVPVAALSVAGFWFARNAILSANPLYPLHLAGAGRVWLAGWHGPDVMRFSPYYLPAGEWRAFVDTVLAVLDPRLAPVWLAALAGAWAWGRNPRTGVDRWVWAASGLALVNVALFWFVIPYRSQQRFMSHALGLAAVPLARTFDRGSWARAVGVTLLFLHVLTPQSWPFGEGKPPWDLFAGVPNQLPALIPLPARLAPGSRGVLDAAIFLAFGLASFAIARATGLAATATTRRARGAALVALTVLVS